MINGTSLIRVPKYFFREAQFRKVRAASKLVYAFLYSRNFDNVGQEYIIYPRADLADDMGVTMEVVGRSMKELVEAGLIREEMIQVGKPKHIYLLTMKEQ